METEGCVGQECREEYVGSKESKEPLIRRGVVISVAERFRNQKKQEKWVTGSTTVLGLLTI